MATPAVSVLLPLYNGDAFIDAAVRSVLAQRFGDFELLILDDGSTDGSLACARAHADCDPRVRVITRENRGLVATLNELLAQARAPLVARMDADDICLPDRFQRQVEFLAEHADVVCVGGDVEMIDAAGRRLTQLTLPRTHAAIQAQALVGHAPLFHPAVMMRTAALRSIDGYRADFWPAEDLDLWLRLGEIGQLVNLPSPPLLRYRLHGGSISGRHLERQRAAARQCCESAWRRRGLSGMQFEASDDWRPGTDSMSQHRFMLRFGWWAFNSGERATAMVYAAKAIRHRPLAPGGWRLLACGLARPTPAGR